jgi:quercetin dioxygenase-like cupin family protein
VGHGADFTLTGPSGEILAVVSVLPPAPGLHLGEFQMKTKILVLAATALGAFLLGGGVVMAQPAGLFKPKIIADGHIAKAAEIGANGIEFSSPKNAHVIVQTGEFEGGASTTWHTHPALTLVTVVDGSVSYRSGCHKAVVYHANESFVEAPNTPVIVDNADGTIPAHVVTTLVFPNSMASRTFVPAPDCTHPADD